MARFRMSRRASRRSFRRGANRVHKMNLSSTHMRGGNRV